MSTGPVRRTYLEIDGALGVERVPVGSRAEAQEYLARLALMYGVDLQATAACRLVTTLECSEALT